jgi:hypothetical protein
LVERTRHQPQPRTNPRRGPYEDCLTTMSCRQTQLGVRENTASPRQHASRLTVDSLPLMSAAATSRLQHRQPTRFLASHASKPDDEIITMPVETATGGKRRDSAEAISAPATTVTVSELRRAPVTPEPFVSADQAAQFLCVKRRYLLELARRGIAGAYSLGTGSKRKIWVFRLSELAASIVRNETSIPKSARPCTIGSGSPR